MSPQDLSKESGVSTRRHQDPARAQARCNQILDAAERCFELHGFHAASMASICAAAQMSAGHVYNYFANKEAIIEAIASRHIQGVIESLNHASDAGVPLVKGLQEHAQARMMKCSGQHDVAIFLELMAEAARNEKMAQMVQSFDQQVKQRLIQFCLDRNIACSVAELEVKIDLFLGLITTYALRLVCNPDLDKTVFFEAICQVIEQVFKEKQLSV